MQIHRNYKYRLYPNKKQIDLLNRHFFSSNQAWNFMLDFKIKEINNIDNMIWVCPSHHAMIEKGLLV